MKNTFALYIPLLFFFATNTRGAQVTQLQDTSITISNSVTGLHVKRQSLDKLSSSKADDIRQFYNNRSYQYAWFNEDGLAEQTQSFWNLYENFLNYSGDSSLYNADLHDRVELFTTSDANFNLVEQDFESTELQLTQLFLNFVERAYTGKVNPKNLQWHIPRKKVNAVKTLREFAENNGKEPESILPINPQYLLMRDHVLRFQKLQNRVWPEISLGKRKVLRLGDSSAVINLIRDHLYILGDLPSANGSNAFDSGFEAAVLSFQRRHGLTDDGIVGPAVIRALNIPIETKIERMLINMERMRWMPAQGEGKRVIVNIPEFRLHVYEGTDEVLNMDVVVGKAANRTVIFSDKIKHVVFSPYWNIPRSIIRNEILPGIEKNPRYLARHNMEVTGERNGLPVIRQKPGRKNALGRVKFIFPNRYSIYLHDTPAKRLFQRTRRDFSHGCIRVAEPFKLAKYLLKDQAEWTAERIEGAMHANSEKWVGLDKPVPVYISYFTSWVDDTGKLNFRDDIYGHDKKVAAHLFN
ncbi:L,D-transpeptidase family protein [Pedobacter sp. P351]|uniref:L,D-transpeptidase family protein n=1 Tax=Pedobacter superstes TaxID=3133441 RepID=UPI003099B008